jgi:hypothetical protein
MNLSSTPVEILENNYWHAADTCYGVSVKVSVQNLISPYKFLLINELQAEICANKNR